MLKRLLVLLTVLLGVTLHVTPPAWSVSSVDQANAFFQRFQQYEQSFDPRTADLYADTARIKSKRIYPNGTSRELVMPASQYKAMIRSVMPLARARNDRNTYSSVSYRPEGKGVRITATRYSLLKKYNSPYSLLIAPIQTGEWKIVEELSVTKP